MKVIGLTGGIATGKSTVTALLQELGAKVVDADEIAPRNRPTRAESMARNRRDLWESYRARLT